MRRATILLALLAGAAAAKPPVVPDYARSDRLERQLNEIFAELKAKEDFEKKPFQERLILKLQQGAKSYEHVKTLDAEAVVEEIFKKPWKEADVAKAPEDVVRILALLPPVLKQQFSGVPIPRQDRYKASKPLVDALMHEHQHMRQAAIDCLYAIYDETRFYKADLPAGRRRAIQSNWKKFISEKRRG